MPALGQVVDLIPDTPGIYGVCISGSLVLGAIAIYFIIHPYERPSDPQGRHTGGFDVLSPSKRPPPGDGDSGTQLPMQAACEPHAVVPSSCAF
jgi:hypothetical protein